MPDLTRRAEQALLGALVTNPGRAAAVDSLTVRDFADQRHQAIFAAITGEAPSSSGLFGRFRGWLLRLPLRRQIRDLRTYVDTLPGLCPDPDHIADYSAMLSQARQRREQAAYAEHAAHAEQMVQAAPGSETRYDRAAGQLQASQAWLDQAARQAATQLAYRPRPAPAVRDSGLPRSVERLAQGLAAPGRLTGPTAPSQATVVAADRESTLSAEDLQDLVLASLLRHPGDVPAVTAWLPAEVFTTNPRQWLYQEIRDRAASGQHIDPLIIAWRAGGRESSGGQSGLAGEILRLGGLPALPGTAAVVGRALFAEHVCTSLYGTDWARTLATPVPDTGQTPAEEHGQLMAEELSPALVAESRPIPAAEPTGLPEQRSDTGPVGTGTRHVPLAVFQHGRQDAAPAGHELLMQPPDGQHADPQPAPGM